MVRVVIRAPFELPEVREIEEGLEPLGQIVGGHVELLYREVYCCLCAEGKGLPVAVACDEDGHAKQLPRCVQLGPLQLVGTVVIVGRDGCKLVSLKEDEAAAIALMLT